MTEILWRVSASGAVFLLVALGEIVSPRRVLTHGRLRRWPVNLGLVGVNNLVVWLLVPLGAAALAERTREAGLGLLVQTGWPLWLQWVAAVVALDFLLWLQHLISHAVPLFWRVHMVHHADMDIDLTTGLRFHPIEIVLSAFFKLSSVFVLGPPAGAVILFEILLNGGSTFNHGNLKLPRKLDKALRAVLVTPDMHRLHHSVLIRETNSNFGFFLSWWDRVFGTYRSMSRNPQDRMAIGLSHIRDDSPRHLLKVLLMPFNRSWGSYSLDAIGRMPPRTEDPE